MPLIIRILKYILILVNQKGLVCDDWRNIIEEPLVWFNIHVMLAAKDHPSLASNFPKPIAGKYTSASAHYPLMWNHWKEICRSAKTSNTKTIYRLDMVYLFSHDILPESSFLFSCQNLICIHSILVTFIN